MDDDCKMKPFCIIFPKTSTLVKSYDRETKWMYFWIEEDKLLENIMIFGIKSAIAL